MAREQTGRMAGPDTARQTESIRSGHDQKMAARFPATLLQNQPVQAFRHPERTESWLRRLTLAQGRLARPQRLGSRGVAGRVGPKHSLRLSRSATGPSV